MCCVEPRTGYTMSVAGLTFCTALCLCSVLLPGWAVKYSTAGAGNSEGTEEQHAVYAGLFWICYNGSFTDSTCVSGDPFGHKALEQTTRFLVLAGTGFQTLGVAVALRYLLCGRQCPTRHRHHHRHHHHHHTWRPRIAVVEVLAIGGGLIFFVGSMCAVAFVMNDEEDDYTFGPSLFLGLGASTLVINFGCLAFIYSRDPDDSAIDV